MTDVSSCLGISSQQTRRKEHTLIRMDILIMFSLLRLRAGGVDRAVGKSLALLQTGGDLDSMHGPGLLVFIPCRAGDVSAHDCLNGENAQLAYLHTPVLQDWAEGFRDLGREVEGDEVGAEGGVCFLQGLEPRLRAEGEENTLVRDTLFWRRTVLASCLNRQLWYWWGELYTFSMITS